MATSTHQPAMRAFTVIKREGQDDFWLPIGAAFAHQSGDGFNVILQALPLPGSNGQCKLVCRPYDPEKAKAEEEQTQATVKKRERVTT